MSGKRKLNINEYRYASKDIPEVIGTTNFFGIKCDEDQQKVVDSVWKREKKLYMINSIAGSGKTLIATALGVLMFKYGLYDRIVYITFPGIYEKSQGFLPGDLLEKSEPYFQPLYNALITIGELPDHVCNTSPQAVDNGTDFIECTVSTYMRGINISKSFVIIDEAENADLETLAKVISRISDDCITLLIGHAGQCDMYDKTKSGFTACIDFNQKYNPDFCESFELFTNHRGVVSQIADRMVNEYEKPCYGFIYLTKNLVTGKIYIGKHKRSMNPEDIDDTWYLGSEKIINHALLEYGEANLKRIILYECVNEAMLNYMNRVFNSYYNIIDDDTFYNTVCGVLSKYKEKHKDDISGNRKVYDILKTKLGELSVNKKVKTSMHGANILYNGSYSKCVKTEMIPEYIHEGWSTKEHRKLIRIPLVDTI